MEESSHCPECSTARPQMVCNPDMTFVAQSWRQDPPQMLWPVKGGLPIVPFWDGWTPKPVQWQRN